VRAARPNARVLLTQMEAPPNLGPRYTTAFRNMFPAVAREEGITLIPFLLQGVAGIEDLNQADGMHPNIEGEQIVARNVWRVLMPVLRARGAPAGAPVGAATAEPGGPRSPLGSAPNGAA
jgi:acyl-CoA thioesterase I